MDLHGLHVDEALTVISQYLDESKATPAGAVPWLIKLHKPCPSWSIKLQHPGPSSCMMCPLECARFHEAIRRTMLIS